MKFLNKKFATHLIAVSIWVLSLAFTAHSALALTCPYNFVPVGAACLPATDPSGLPSGGTTMDLPQMIIYIINILLAFAAIVAVLILIIGGYMYIFDLGDEKRSKKGKAAVVNALIGIAIIILSYTIVMVVSNTVYNSGLG